MKKRLYLKLLIGYVIFGILGFILVSTFSSHYTYEYIEDTEVDRLYKEANMIASTYASNYFNEDITVDDLHDSLATLSTYLSSEIWVMNTDGDILINSNASVDMDHLTHIDGFNVADFGSNITPPVLFIIIMTIRILRYFRRLRLITRCVDMC